MFGSMGTGFSEETAQKTALYAVNASTKRFVWGILLILGIMRGMNLCIAMPGDLFKDSFLQEEKVYGKCIPISFVGCIFALHKQMQKFKTYAA